MHSGFFGIRNQLPMNCKAIKKNYTIDDNCRSEIERIQQIWSQCLEKKPGGPWLFGEFSVADAMYVPIVSRFLTYQIHLEDSAQQYLNFVSENGFFKEWLEASQKEEEIIEDSEVGDDL